MAPTQENQTNYIRLLYLMNFFAPYARTGTIPIALQAPKQEAESLVAWLNGK